MRIIADLHIHSQYSRATSREMNLSSLDRWAQLKGISLLGTGDFTHPVYFTEMKASLEEDKEGLYVLKGGDRKTRFILSAEVSNIFPQAGKTRKVHTLIFAPRIEIVEKINLKLMKFGKLASDGRPIVGFPAKDLVKLVLDISEECVLVPAHIWTPWFSLFGSKSGFDSLEECFEEQSPHIFALETGLSSDPSMNWRLSALDSLSLISNSDAHSPWKLGREANVFECPLEYSAIMKSIRDKDPEHFLFTVEFFPEEGKYHYDGHRNCNVILSPAETRDHDYLCPKCKKKITVGVMHRVEVLADRPDGYRPSNAVPARHMIPLEEIISEARGVGVGTKTVREEYLKIVSQAGSEFAALLDCPEEELRRYTSERIVQGIKRTREGRVSIVPGHDGVFGVIKLFPGEERKSREATGQRNLSA